MPLKDYVESQAKKLDSAEGARKVRASIAKKKLREDQRWAFGFRFFAEQKNFGLDSNEIDKGWTLSVMYRLKEMSDLKVAEVMESPQMRDSSMRIHEIDWNGKGVPIARADLDWLDPSYVSNPQDYPIIQLAVSKAVGRLVGFLDEDNVFQIVLLDPLHNAQPAKRNDYAVRLCQPLGCEITAVKYQVVEAVKRLGDKECGCAAEFSAAIKWSKWTPGVAVVIPMIEGTELADADKLIDEGVTDSYHSIFAAGLVALS